MSAILDHEARLLWAAGYFESGAQVSPWHQGISLRIRKKNPESLIVFREIVGIGAVLEPTGKEQRHTYRADNREVEEIAQLLAPWLTEGTIERLEQLGVLPPAAT